MEMLANDKPKLGGSGTVVSPAASNRQVLGAVTASCMGWALDLFDLFILLFVAPVIGKLFFPSEHAMLSLAAVYASFAVTLLMRPLGSAIFGSYADRHGRKGAMVVAVTGVGLSTAAFGLLPTVGQIGLFAPALFILLRLVQGVFVGGVVASTHTIGTESVPPSWRGAVSGLVGGGGAGIGALLASITYMAMTALFPGDAFENWGWRCMFFAGIVSSVLGLVIFNSLEESPLWKQLQAAKAASGQAKPQTHPLRTLFSREYRGVLLVNILLTVGGGSAYYLTSGYLPTFLKVVVKASPGEAAATLMLSSVGVIVASVAAGHLSTMIGRKRAFLLIGAVSVVLMPLLYQWMPAAPTAVLRGVYAAALSMLGCAGFAPILIFLNERFPTSIRASGTGLSWNIGFAIGGMMPTLASLAARTPADLPVVLGIFVAVVTLIYLAGAAIVPETLGRLAEK
ncbi:MULTISPECIES: MFS transporter [Cupriavidus]|uniref:Proline/betaine transporter n=1 Tax=Cupriavidus numazuensis TaxID=221992 RepID=A0ABM8TUA6_9BURK|nr:MULTISPECIES: MFS transporter [Cupriavidus]QYY34121.1 MFS transporter [Cupriavidus pinatubonensis]TPQ34151.1 MFS transporter [Cupriavidus pinatubonensis]CAG2159992.1 Proline/betaine transporter [Cupriavidus numazuensis]